MLPIRLHKRIVRGFVLMLVIGVFSICLNYKKASDTPNNVKKAISAEEGFDMLTKYIKEVWPATGK